MSITPPGPMAIHGDASANATSKVSAPKQPKKKSIFSMLCCGIPDHGNSTDPNEGAVPANKVTKISATGRPTSSSKPENVGAQQNNVAQPDTEKEALKQQTDPGHDRGGQTSSDPSPQPPSSAPAPANGEENRSSDIRDQPLPGLPQETEPPRGPPVIVQPPVRQPSNRVPQAPVEDKDKEGDVQMHDSDPLPEKETLPDSGSRKEENADRVLPPPPPVPPGPSEEPVPEPADAEQKWLLPPIAPRFKGKKCLVLDLDETLVHSSFKVRVSVLNQVTCSQYSRYCTKQTLQSPLR
jgi:RNA polymerase II subunit A small phosphatase-like protein